jgi:hypothetical protein
MKGYISLIILVMIVFRTLGQPKHERYCEVSIDIPGMILKIDSGMVLKDSILNNAFLKSVNTSAKSRYSVADVLNKMSELGWNLINTTVVGQPFYIKYFYFKKDTPHQ